MIRQHPWFSAAIIITLALGIGVNTTVFTLVNAVLYKPLPFPGGDRLVMIPATQAAQQRNQVSISYADFRDFRQENKTFERLEAFSGIAANITESGNPPDRYSGVRITSGMFDMLKVQPVLGRGLTAADEKAGAESVLLLGYGVWAERYGKDPSVIGRAVRVNEQPAVIIGVIPEGIAFPNNEKVWMNAVPDAASERRDNRGFMMVGMRKLGVSQAEAQADMAIIAQRLEQQFPDSHKGYGIAVKTFHEIMNGGTIRLVFGLMLGAVGFVLLIACANVANMLLGRALARRREISIRVAMGASRGRILRQLLVESVVLSTIGGLIGLAMAKGGVDAFSRAVQNVGKPYWITFEMDYLVFLYFAGICVAAGMLFGLLPALQATRVDLNESLKEGAKGSGGKRTGYLSSALVVFQFTLAVILLSAAGLMVRSFVIAQEEFAGMHPEKVLHARVSLPNNRYSTPELRRQFYDKLLPRLASLPGAQAVSMTTTIPGTGTGSDRFEIAGEPALEHEQRPTAAVISAAPGYFHLLGMNIVQGRDFRPEDGLPGHLNVIVSQQFARRYFPKKDPVGSQLRFYDRQRKAGEWVTIVGVSPDIRQSDPSNPQQGAIVTRPYNWEAHQGMSLLVRTAGDSVSLGTAVRREVQQIDADLPLFEVSALDVNLERSRWHLRVFGTLFLVFAVIALGMASVGIYAVIAHATGQRTREIGVRLALGAGPASIVQMVMNRGLLQIGIGLTLGLGAAYFLCRLMERLLIQVSPSDPSTYLFVGGVLLLAGLAACLIPARRASRLDPLEALRHE